MTSLNCNKIVPEVLNILNLLKIIHALVMVCQVLGPPAMEFFVQKANDFKKSIVKTKETKNYWIWSGGLLKKRNLILAE